MPHQPKRVVGTPDENLIVEALMHFFEVVPVRVGSEKRWPGREVASVGAVLNSLPLPVRQELSEVISREYVEHVGPATGYEAAGPPPAASPWVPQAKEFVMARFQFFMDNGADRN